MATEEQIEDLRLALGEPTEESGESLFTDLQLSRVIDRAADGARAAAEGWQLKAAHFANLVNVTDGAASREFGSLLKNAQDMQKLYAKGGPAVSGRSRVGRIRRTQ